MICTSYNQSNAARIHCTHAGQTGQTGVPYIFHTMHVAKQMPDEITTCVALLHDVLEDIPASLDDLLFYPLASIIVGIMVCEIH